MFKQKATEFLVHKGALYQQARRDQPVQRVVNDE